MVNLSVSSVCSFIFIVFFNILSCFFNTQLYNQCPTLMQFLPGRHQTAFASLARVKEFIKQHVEKHRADRNPSNPRDYIDCYLDEIEKVEIIDLGG